MKHITEIRKAVCTIANRLCKEGLSKAAAFAKAWRTVKGITFRAAGTTFDNGQNKLRYLGSFPAEDIQIAFQRETGNEHDKNAVAIWAKVKSVNRIARMGYVPHTIAVRLAAIMDKGIKVTGHFGSVIGGYGSKENYGLLISLAI